MSSSVVNHPEIFGPNGGTISLTYDAAGRKWRKQITGVTKDYCQGIEYKDGKVEAVYGQEGRLTAVYDQYGVTLTSFRAEYWLKDHLGNTRIAFADPAYISANLRLLISTSFCPKANATWILAQDIFCIKNFTQTKISYQF